MTSNILENVNIDPSSFQIKKAEKRKGDASLGAMDIDSYNGIEGSTSQQSTNNKRRKPSSEGIRKVPVPSHRYTPLKENWLKIFTPIVEHLHLQVRFNLKTRNVEIRPSNETTDIANLQKAADFVKAFVYGFEVEDALALLRLDDLFVETFEVKDVKTLKGDHQSRAVGRLAGKGDVRNSQ
ncbi:ribonuclease y [Holotrichia oblita]|uniref:Ribonuclease y n=1 Tax=Holotrichia oblita TaxID=644536 RepID=A0ACB9TLK7_HOLOL|nr:ribonuclease y [Holotrichia oblita]